MSTGEPSREQLLWMYETMVKIRHYEESLAQAYSEGKSPRFDISAGPVPGELHLAAGQEPCAVGVCIHLRPEDTVTATHRPHHVAIAKGVDLKRMTAEIFGKATGLSGGRGGHMHLFDPAVHFSCSGIVGEGLPPAVGAALAAKMQGKDWVAVAYTGEGGANQGAFHEAVNLAALWKLPVVFVIEDNAWAISVAKDVSTAVPRNSDRASAYGVPGVYVADNDTLAVFQAAGEAVARARRGEGPTILEIETYRYYGHFEGDPQIYRPADEVKRLQEKDPIVRLRDHLLREGVLDEASDREVVARAQREVDEAMTFARESPYPAPEEALENVFA
ncbi:MAG: thiamine pyrophosphate-dependent dehydrogenase E1 component subunit alpha [Bacillota bacterium]|nr:thiamine pyrophosphate-dependent dehydrogenase E1 component subunit alpha [Bacillota bacterium]